ncbi:hypothetical protein CROQUDRAFT_98706 [Cronartium quercuum f. sp. fusiforme G11]|uniref:Uncharacterized protein n=1 Tax=Cronartium quercuum f. sp. fusiforme G11 TaxID=708437 RepID=A0A9P6NCZ5_9BASI|nr:hypothetical protein CROQUDRAFT_98706 [Cronartium quercuum f. sp. fusiforme G11]
MAPNLKRSPYLTGIFLISFDSNDHDVGLTCTQCHCQPANTPLDECGPMAPTQPFCSLPSKLDEAQKASSGSSTVESRPDPARAEAAAVGFEAAKTSENFKITKNLSSNNSSYNSLSYNSVLVMQSMPMEVAELSPVFVHENGSLEGLLS